MATQDKETKIVDLFQGNETSPQSGMSVSNGDWGISFIQNMQVNRKAWEARPGFGVMCQYDTKLNAGKYKETFQIGLERHLGSHVIKQTSFNHEQIVSIWRARLIPENMSGAQDARVENLIQQRKVYVVRIYDTNTDETWEEVLHYHTSQEEGLLFRRHANYETSVGSYSIWDRQTWVDAGQNEGDLTKQFQNDRQEFFQFTEVSGLDKSVRLIFGSERAGTWIYCPTDFRAFEYSFRERWHQAQADATQDWRDPYAESPLIIPLRVTNGSFADNGQGLTYMDQATFGRPQASCALDTRVVYAVDNLLYFSDPEVPNAILELNVEPFPAKIVAVAPTIGNLIVWTEDRKCYYYNPATGAEMALISGGRTTEMSSHIGIVNCNAWVSVEGGIIWIDPTGIWRNYGNVTIQKLSDPIDPFFTEKGISNPLTNYYTENGDCDPTAEEQPLSFYNWNPDIEVGINAAYLPKKGQIFFNIPQLNITYVIEGGLTHVWNYESVVSTKTVIRDEEEITVPVVKAERNLPFSWILTNNNDVYMVSGTTEQEWIDKTSPGGSAVVYINIPPDPPIITYPDYDPRNISRDITSGLLLKLQRGGGLDRSLQYLKEDRRRVVGEYYEDNGIEDITFEEDMREQGYVYFDKIRKIDTGYKFSWTAGHGNPMVFVDRTDISPIWLPIKFVPQYVSQFQNVGYIQIKFKFDNINWSPYITNANILGYEPVFNLPPERLGGKLAYNIGTANFPATDGVYVLDDTGVPNPEGNTIVINISGPGSGGSWSGFPRLNLCARFKNEMIELAFRRNSISTFAASTKNVWDMGIEFISAEAVLYDEDGINVGNYFVPARVWRDHTYTDNASYQQQDDAFQAVDWCYQGAPISDENVVKLRGINAIIQSSYTGVPEAGKGWDVWGVRLFNSIFSSNWKAYAAQFIDYASTYGPNSVVKFLKGTLRSRVKDGTDMYRPTFYGEAGTTSVTPGVIKWGDPNDVDVGNFLIGDGPVDNIRASADVKGEGVQALMFGHIMNYAERIRIVSAKAVVRVIGSLRRKGRP